MDGGTDPGREIDLTLLGDELQDAGMGDLGLALVDEAEVPRALDVHLRCLV